MWIDKEEVWFCLLRLRHCQQEGKKRREFRVLAWVTTQIQKRLAVFATLKKRMKIKHCCGIYVVEMLVLIVNMSIMCLTQFDQRVSELSGEKLSN